MLTMKLKSHLPIKANGHGGNQQSTSPVTIPLPTHKKQLRRRDRATGEGANRIINTDAATAAAAAAAIPLEGRLVLSGRPGAREGTRAGKVAKAEARLL